MKRFVARALVLGMLAAGCTSSPPATFNGTIHGQTVPANDAVSSTASVPVGTVNLSVGVVVITNGSGVCSNISKNPPEELKNSTYFIILLGDYNATSSTVSPPSSTGTYAVFAGSGTPPAKLALVLFNQRDAQCTTVPATVADGASGSVALTGLNGTSYSGSFDVTMSSGDHVTGTFNATSCPALGTVFSAQTVCI